MAAGRGIILAAVLAAAVLTGCGGKDTAAVMPDYEMVFVKGGTFEMGCTFERGGQYCNYNEKPPHSVTVGDFQIGRYEVTQKQWFDVMGGNPSYYEGDNLPVENVSWDDVQEFIDRLNAGAKNRVKYRLPTEAEWEYAARGGEKSEGRRYAGSDSIDAVAWCRVGGEVSDDDKTREVGTKAPNELGLYDMSGNVSELVSDECRRYDVYSGSAITSYPARVYRGGSWLDIAAGCCVFSRFFIPIHAPPSRVYDPDFDMPVSDSMRERLGLSPRRWRVSWFSRAVSDVVEFLRYGVSDFMQNGIVKIVRDIRGAFKPPEMGPEQKILLRQSATRGFRLATDP